ncbi:MAG: hypothetical protein E7208_11560 [Clostridium butyricum]|nr:hypothetical protein [Clostridium butyricum]
MINNKVKLFVSMTIALALIFSATYICMDNYYNKESKEPNIATQNTMNEGNILNDKVKVVLFAGDKKENEYSLLELKEKFNITEDLTDSGLIKLLEKEGYVLNVEANNEMMFKRDVSKTLEANKYYIGEKNGFLAIYKTDDDGELKIENPSDVYSDFKTVDSFGKIDKEKIRNFEFMYNSKEEAEENLSEFLS